MTPETFFDGRVELHSGDCMTVLAGLKSDSVDSTVTDPPYHLASIVARFGGKNAAPAQFGKDGAFARASAGFMNKQWDGGDIAFQRETWAEVFRVLKPGGHLVAFAATRNYHRMACAIEDAGFEIRDMLQWLYGTGMPKNHPVKVEGFEGWGTALKPALEPICFARKPLIGTVAENIREHGPGAINIDGCRIPTEDKLGGGAEKATTASQKGNEGWTRPWMDDETARAAHASRVRSNVEKAEALGRYPANVLHDGSAEVEACLGTDALRFFYSAKADAKDRLGSNHPTVKPVDLMQWLVTLVTPSGGTVLDLFAGTGSTGEAAYRAGMKAILIEREAEYQADIRRRMSFVSSSAATRKIEHLKKRDKVKPVEDMPLFGGEAA